MKLKGLLSLGLIAIICGCSCGKVNETTYINAVSNFNSSDAMSFTRIEDVFENDSSTAKTRTRVDAAFIFDVNRSGEVMEVHYKIETYDSHVLSGVLDYYYSAITHTMYREKVVSGVSGEKIKENMEYEDHFNVHGCETTACRVAILSNLAPILEIEDVNGFVIEKEDDEAVATFSAACPVYEVCKGNDKLDYTLRIGGDGNIKNLSYTISDLDTTTRISYSFTGFGANNVEIEFPSSLNGYVDGNIE